MKYRAAIFDLDGTLLDSETLWVEATEQYLNDRGHALGREESLSIVYGRSWRDVYTDIITRHPELDETIEEMEESMRVYMLDLRDGRDVIIESSLTLLKRLAQGMPVCIVSGSPRADVEAAVDLMGIRDILEFAIGAEDYGPGKPDPTCFTMAAERLGVFVRSMINRLLSLGELGCAGQILLMELGHPTEVIEMVRMDAIEPIRFWMDRIIRDLLGEGASQKQVSFCIISVVHQCLALGFRQGKTPPPFRGLDPRQLKEDLAEHIYHFSMAGIAAVRLQIEGNS